MTKKILCIAPHPDDETFGCGGTLLREIHTGVPVAWLIVTGMEGNPNYSTERIASRAREIDAVATAYPFVKTYQLNLPTAQLDVLPLGDVIAGISAAVKDFEPSDIYMPHRRDAHSDHAVVFDATAACTKWFRYPSVRRVLTYETQSETDFDISPDSPGFRPNVFVDISTKLARKVEILSFFGPEIGEHPFPRSTTGARALAHVRGATCGVEAAEAFMLLRERII